MKTISFKLIGRWLITVCGDVNPADEDWNACAKAFKTMPVDELGILIYTKGGVPTAAQRKIMNDVSNGREPTTAIVSSSTVVRGVATAMSWFNRRIKVFSPDKLRGALQYLEVPSVQHDQFEREVARMLADIEGPAATATGTE